jgi:peptidoglycan/xylan/chitin deacetylase (PgdA/CDA1 family)
MWLNIVFVIFIGACYAHDEHEGQYVSFRVDNVQAGWCSGVVLQSVVKMFQNCNMSVTLGIVGYGLESDSGLVTYLQSLVDDPQIEFANRAYSQEPFTGLTLEEQIESLNKTNAVIKRLLNVNVTTFVAPDNVYNDNVTIAMLENRLTTLSAMCRWNSDADFNPTSCAPGSNVVAPNILYNGISMLPAGAVLGYEEHWRDSTLPINANRAKKWLMDQIRKHELYHIVYYFKKLLAITDYQGFSVMMVQPREFATDNSCTAVDLSRLAILRDILEYMQLRNHDWEVVTLQHAASDMWSNALKPTPSPAASPSSSSESEANDDVNEVIIFVVSVVGAAIILGVCLCMPWMWARKPPVLPSYSKDVKVVSAFQFDISLATSRLTFILSHL